MEQRFSFSPNLALTLQGCFSTEPPPISLFRSAPISGPKMSAPAKRCPGCLKLFTSEQAHLAQASNILCRRLAKKRRLTCLGFIRTSQHNLTQQPIPQSPSTPSDSPPVPTNSPPSPPGEGGNQLPDQEPPHIPSGEDGWDDEESDEDEDLSNMLESSSPGWEPPVPQDADNMSISSNNTDLGPLPPSAPLEDIREQ